VVNLLAEKKTLRIISKRLVMISESRNLSWNKVT
jgi:hypothetical protein